MFFFESRIADCYLSLMDVSVHSTPDGSSAKFMQRPSLGRVVRLFEYQGRSSSGSTGSPSLSPVLSGPMPRSTRPSTRSVSRRSSRLRCSREAGERRAASPWSSPRTRPGRRPPGSMELRIGGEKPSALLLEKRRPDPRGDVPLGNPRQGDAELRDIGARVGGVEVESMQGKIIEPVPVDGLKAMGRQVGCLPDGPLGARTRPSSSDILMDLERLSREEECELAEINPLAITARWVHGRPRLKDNPRRQRPLQAPRVLAAAPRGPPGG